jgi:hypothetical protein
VILAHHAGEELLLAAAAGTGLIPVLAAFARARVARLVRRRRRR